MPKKVKALQSSDGQLFLDGGKLVTHEIRQTIVKALPNSPEAATTADAVAEALTKNHTVLFDALKLLRAPVKRKAKPAATAPAAATKK